MLQSRLCLQHRPTLRGLRGNLNVITFAAQNVLQPRPEERCAPCHGEAVSPRVKELALRTMAPGLEALSAPAAVPRLEEFCAPIDYCPLLVPLCACPAYAQFHTTVTLLPPLELHLLRANDNERIRSIQS